MGKYLRERLEKLGIEEVRGMGLMVGARVENAPSVASKCLEKGLLVNAPADNALRFVPPLVIGKEEIDFAVEILSSLI